MTISIHSTERRSKAALDLKEPGRASMYVCGPTVYDSCHIGHARPAVVFDAVRRYLEYSGLIVTFISNITDIDDKIINRANELGIPYRALARRYQDEYEQDMARLGVLSPSIRPRATEHIREMIALVEGLMEKGFAYQTPRGVWYDVSKFKGYGKLSGRTMDDENTEHRVEQDPEKKNPQDFALWKTAKPGEPSWESPWGPGRPGWHLECSAMAGKYCDFEIDIHGGGADLSFPHHENELAQSEAFTGRRFVRQWMHNGFITVGKTEDGGDVKMGKSKGNAFWLRDAFRIASPAALRLWILGTHYRMPLLYKPELLGQSQNALDRIYNALDETALRLEKEPGARPSPDGVAAKAAESERRFREAMDDDFNTPQALAPVFELATLLNVGVKENAPAGELLATRNILNQLLWVLGLPPERPESAGGGGADGFIDLLVAVRNRLRADKNFPLSDMVRDGLKELGVEIKDRGAESTWAKNS